MENENKNKYDFLVQLLGEGDAMVCLDARLSSVDVPKIHKGNSALSLIFNLNFKRPFDVQEHGIYATLSFAGRPHKCVIPFEAIWAIHEPESKNGQVWEESFPNDLKLKVGNNGGTGEPVLVKLPETSVGEKELGRSKTSKKVTSSRSNKKDRSYLTVIK